MRQPRHLAQKRSIRRQSTIMKHYQRQRGPANQRAPVDAAIALSLHFEGHCRRASVPERWVP